MDNLNLWQRKKLNPFAGFVKRLKREECLVHAKKPEYSLSIVHPVTLVPFSVVSSFYHDVTLYKDGVPIGKKEVPDYMMTNFLSSIGKNIM